MTAELPSPSEGWELVTDANRRPELIRRLREGVPEPWSDALYQAIVVDELSGAPALAAALSVAGSVAGRLVPQHRQEIFLSCITLLRQPVDPYDRSATRLATAARHAAAELLAADPALDGRAIEALATRDVPTLLPAVASALRAGRDPDAKRFERYVQALSLSREQLVRFAEDSSADNSPVQLEPHPALPTLSKRRRRWTLARAPVTDLAAFVTGPALAAGLALVGSCVDGRLTNVSADAGVAVGALAVLAAVHVLSVQLAATSLPSPVAAAAVAPTPIKVAYGIGIAALGVALLAEVDRPPFGWHPGAVAAVLVVLTTALVAFVTITTLRDLGAAPASVRAARNGAAEALRAAEVVVALRRQSRDLAAAVDGADYLRRQLSADETVERRPVVARSSGVLEVDSQALVELSRRRSWREGDLRLDVLQAPGIGVPAGTELASVVASANVVISDNDYQAAASAFRVAPQPRLRALDTLCVALVDELLALARAGDTTGARTIQAELLSLLEVHLAALREVEGAGAPAPVLLAVVSRALRALADGREDEPVHCVELLQGVVRHTVKDGGVIGLIAMRVVGDGPASLDQLSVLYNSGQRAIQLESDGELLLVQDTLRRLMSGQTTSARFAHETAARLVQYAAIVDPVASRRVWQRYLQAREPTPEGDQVRNICRIGAVALRVGNLSLAVEAAFALPDSVALDRLSQMFHHAEHASRENLLSEVGGRLLGTDAESRLARFAEVAEVFRRS